jgi:endonuclease III
VKKPFNIHTAVERLRLATAGLPKAAMFALAQEGFTSLFQQLVACLISVRTRDETSLPAARELLRRAPTPQAVAEMSPNQVDVLIQQSTFHARKAVQIHAMALRILKEMGGELPCDSELLQSFEGIGPKCAHLALGIACGQPRISVDVHVHRVTNRWGYVHTSSPEQTMRALEALLPEAYYIEINSLLVPFGKHICTGVRPRCPTCPLLDMCQQVGVTETRVV